MRTLLWVMTLIGGLLAAVMLFFAFLLSRHPDGSIAIGFAAVPYVLARAWEEIRRKG